MDKLKQKLNIAEDEINGRIEAYDEDISLVERKYGSFIDEHYKSLFISYNKFHMGNIDALIFRAAEDIQKKYNTSGMDFAEISSRKKKKKISLFQNMKNLFDIE